MRVKRFFAADMRSAMKLVRDEMGADASIIANRRVAGGIELTAALDYEALRLTPPTPGLDTELKKTQERILSAGPACRREKHQRPGPASTVNYLETACVRPPSGVRRWPGSCSIA